MARLFNKLRKLFLKEHKVRSYFIYAIGETVLVVIGILIALQLNNWQTKQNNRKEERFYLNKLRQNITQDIFYLNKRLTQLKFSEQQLNQLILEINDNSTLEFSIDSVGKYLVGVYRFSPQTSTMDNLLSTGKLDLISNQALVDSLFVYYNDLNNFPNQVNASNDAYSRQTFGPGLMEFEGGVFGLKKSTLNDRDKTFLENSIEMKHYINTSLAKYYDETTIRAKNIISMLPQNSENND